MILNGYEVKVIDCKLNKFGYLIMAYSDERTFACHITQKTGTSYGRVYMGTRQEVEEAKGEITHYYLHNIVYAFSCGWKNLWIAPNCDVHHINHDDELKKDLRAYNDITNLIYLTHNNHKKIHSLENIIARFEKDRAYTETEYEMAKKEYNDIMAKAIKLRDNTIKKNNPIVWERIQIREQLKI